MSTGLQFIGPIQTSQPFFIASGYPFTSQETIGSEPYILSFGVTRVASGYYTQVAQYDPYNAGAVLSGAAAIFNVINTSSGFNFYDVVNVGYLNVDSDNILVMSDTPADFNLIQYSVPQYQPWNDPNVFLSNVIYQIAVTGSVPVTAYYLTDFAGLYIDELLFEGIPTTWYYGTGGACKTVVSPITTLATWACSINPLINYCSASSLTGIQQGWTNLLDCSSGITYSYCLEGDYCGISGCNGPCSSTDNTCENVSGSYVCVAPPSPTPTPTPTPTPKKSSSKKVFVGVIVGVSVLVLIIIIIIIIKNNSKTKESE
jgi:hypothetical protein